MAPPSLPTPQERLAISRRAMVKHMTRDKRAAQNIYAQEAHDVEETALHHNAVDGTWRVVKHAVRTWWHHHPVSVALDIARPVLSQYAREHPVKLVGMAAALGVATVLLRPWRLVSMGSVIAATFKPPQLPSFLLSMLSPNTDNDFNSADTDTRRPP